jgi:hypothetical protein
MVANGGPNREQDFRKLEARESKALLDTVPLHLGLTVPENGCRGFPKHEESSQGLEARGPKAILATGGFSEGWRPEG